MSYTKSNDSESNRLREEHNDKLAQLVQDFSHDSGAQSELTEMYSAFITKSIQEKYGHPELNDSEVDDIIRETVAMAAAKATPEKIKILPFTWYIRDALIKVLASKKLLSPE